MTITFSKSLKRASLFASVIAILALPGCDKTLHVAELQPYATPATQTSQLGVNNQQLVFQPGETNVTFTNANGLTLNAKLFMPTNLQPGERVPAMVIMHGCGGMWYKDNVQLDSVKASLYEWSTLLKARKIATLYVDSFTPRNEIEFCGITPPNDAKLSPAYERPHDAYAALSYLRTRSDIIGDRIGVLGLSHGGSTVISALVNTTTVTKLTWTVSSGGVSYTVPAPVAAPAQGGFKAAVAYYPGGHLFGYYGKLSNYKDGKYINYAPLLIQSAEKDVSLTAGTQVQYNRAVHNGSATIEMDIYAGANHSFDEAKSAANGADWTAKLDARQRVLNWLDAKL